MKRLLKIVGIVLVSIILVLLLFIYVYFREAIHIEKYTPEELASLLTPYFQINKPPGDGPFPAVIRFPGSGGVFLPNGDIGLAQVSDLFIIKSLTSFFQ